MISIPIIILRKSSFNLRRKVNIGIVLCLSLFMIAIGLVRGISAGVMGSDDQVWTVFWVHVEASVSVIAVCPTAFRSLFLIKNTPGHTPDNHRDGNQGHASMLEKIWRRRRREKPTLASINVRATLTGMKTLIRDNGQTQLELQDDDDKCALSSTKMQNNIHLSQSPEATRRRRSMEMIVTHEVVKELPKWDRGKV